MAIGMTYEQYWYGDPLMARAFYEAEKTRQERMNLQAWLNGVYVLRALDSTVGNVFRPKGSKPEKYPETPIPLTKPQSEPQDEDQETAFARAYMMQMMEAGKNWGK